MANKRGFSFVEVLIFCFISVILLTLIVGMISNSKDFSRTLGCINNMKTISQAIEQFQGDNNETPASLADLYPRYITSNNVFHCPSDSHDGNSYESIYIGRSNIEEDANKMFLACHRHHKNSKAVVAYLSYAVDIGKSQKVTWSGMPVEYGQLCNPGVMGFADGTQVEIKTGNASPLSSFISNEEKIYSIIYVPDKTNTTLEINHHGDTIFEIITPAVIAGVEGTKFTVATLWFPEVEDENPTNSTTVSVTEGAVNLQERTFAGKKKLAPQVLNTMTVSAIGWKESELPPSLLEQSSDPRGRMNFVSRKPKRRHNH